MKLPTLLQNTQWRTTENTLLFDRSYGIRSNRLIFVPTNKFERLIPVAKNEDCSIPFNLAIFELADPNFRNHIVSCRGSNIISSTSTFYTIEEGKFDQAYNRLKELPNDWFEIWADNHNVNEGFHFPDRWGEPTEILEHLSMNLDVMPPKVNHNKLSSKQVDKFSCDEMHLDSFEGMRKDDFGRRQRIFRHFLNLGNKPRTTLVAVHDTDLVDRYVGSDYRPDYLNPIIQANRCVLPVLKLTLPPRDPVTKQVFGYKILTTHLVHGEYGERDDFLAIVNSLT